MDGIEGKLEAESPSRKLLLHQSGTERLMVLKGLGPRSWALRGESRFRT